MSTDLKFKLDKISDALEKYKDGEQLPISIRDIHFILGACNQLLSNMTKLEKSYKADMMSAGEQVSKFRNKWKETRQISVRLDNQIMSLRQIVKESRALSWWRMSKRLREKITSHDLFMKKSIEPVSVPKNI